MFVVAIVSTCLFIAGLVNYFDMHATVNGLVQKGYTPQYRRDAYRRALERATVSLRAWAGITVVLWFMALLLRSL